MSPADPSSPIFLCYARTETSWDNTLFELESDAFLGAGDEVYISYGDTKTSLSFLIA